MTDRFWQLLPNFKRLASSGYSKICSHFYRWKLTEILTKTGSIFLLGFNLTSLDMVKLWIIHERPKNLCPTSTCSLIFKMHQAVQYQPLYSVSKDFSHTENTYKLALDFDTTRCAFCKHKVGTICLSNN